jgi:hypothetical protein
MPINQENPGESALAHKTPVPLRMSFAMPFAIVPCDMAMWARARMSVVGRRG